MTEQERVEYWRRNTKWPHKCYHVKRKRASYLVYFGYEDEDGSLYMNASGFSWYDFYCEPIITSNWSRL